MASNLSHELCSLVHIQWTLSFDNVLSFCLGVILYQLGALLIESLDYAGTGCHKQAHANICDTCASYPYASHRHAYAMWTNI